VDMCSYIWFRRWRLHRFANRSLKPKLPKSATTLVSKRR